MRVSFRLWFFLFCFSFTVILSWNGGGERLGVQQSPQILLLSWQLTASLDCLPITKIYQAAALAHCFRFSVGAGHGTNTLPIQGAFSHSVCTAIIITTLFILTTPLKTTHVQKHA